MCHRDNNAIRAIPAMISTNFATRSLSFVGMGTSSSPARALSTNFANVGEDPEHNDERAYQVGLKSERNTGDDGVD